LESQTNKTLIQGFDSIKIPIKLIQGFDSIKIPKKSIQGFDSSPVLIL
jgi:hypothetical protein